MRVVACYPRTRSAWLSNLITIPHCSLYAHDILMQPDLVEILEGLDYPHKGVVDTAATPENVPDGTTVTVIDADPADVLERSSRWMGRDMSDAVEWCRGNIEALKPMAENVYSLDRMDEWIEAFHVEHTGLPLDWGRYTILQNLNVQSQLARSLEN